MKLGLQISRFNWPGSPQPLSHPHPPILIGGESEKKILRLVAQNGDMCNLRLGSPLMQAPQPIVICSASTRRT